MASDNRGGVDGTAMGGPDRDHSQFCTCARESVGGIGLRGDGDTVEQITRGGADREGKVRSKSDNREERRNIDPRAKTETDRVS